jgi:hypothetical protein
VVSVTDPYGLILGFLDRLTSSTVSYFSNQNYEEDSRQKSEIS